MDRHLSLAQCRISMVVSKPAHCFQLIQQSQAEMKLTLLTLRMGVLIYVDKSQLLVTESRSDQTFPN